MRRIHRQLNWVIVLSGLFLGGCGSTDFGGDIVVPARQRDVLSQVTRSGDPIRLPGDRLFNIHLKTSGQTPGPDGQGRGDSDATADGKAFCLAESANGGSATAQFRLGHQVEHRAAVAQWVDIDVELELERAIHASATPSPDTLAQASLHLLVIDQRKKQLADVALDEATSDNTPGQSSSTERHHLRVLFQPEMTYNIILFGRTQSSSATQEEAGVRIDIRQVKMDLEFSPGPATSQPENTM